MSQIIPIYIPTYINSAEYTPARVLPRLFFYNGQLDCESWWIQDSNGAARIQSNFPYFDNYNVVSGSFPTADSDSLLFTNETAVYGSTPDNSLYTNYWDTYISLLYNPKTRLVNCSAIIPLADYFKMELNDIVNFRGNYYHLRAINDYSLKTGECNLQLLGPIISNAFSQVQPTQNCTFTFTSSLVTTTTTTTAGPTTTTTSTTTTESPFLNIEYLIVAGGGGGSNDNFAGREAYAAGGGAGGYISGSTTLSGSNILNVVVGTGGTAGTYGSSNNQSGTNSSFLSLTAIGGGYGGRQSGTGIGANGGSGGGGYLPGAGGTGTSGQGFAGNSGARLIGLNLYRGGNGGGASSAPYGSGDLGAQNPGLSKQWLDGLYYSSGGKGAGSNNDPENPGAAGNGGVGVSEGVGTAGQNGIVKIRYAGTPRATGGDISQSGGYTYHTFSSNGIFAWNTPITTTTTTTIPPNPCWNQTTFYWTSDDSVNWTVQVTYCDGSTGILDGSGLDGVNTLGPAFGCIREGGIVGAGDGTVVSSTTGSMLCGTFATTTTTTTTLSPCVNYFIQNNFDSPEIYWQATTCGGSYIDGTSYYSEGGENTGCVQRGSLIISTGAYSLTLTPCS
jgi:hypothetical protein